MRNMMILFLLQALYLFSNFSVANAQTKDQNNYISAIDSDLSIKTFLLAPFSDNISGIYANPLQTVTSETLDSRYQWEVKTLPASSTNYDSLTERPTEVAKILQANSSQALVTARITKGPKGISYHLVLYVGKEGHPYAIEDETNLQSLETDKLKESFRASLTRILNKIPYQGVILSRRGLEVTINLGKLHGLRPEMEVQVIQILSAKRHPKLKTVIATDKEILGKIKVTKVDDALSFGQITLEREIGLLKPNMKIQASEFITYPEPIAATDIKTSDALSNRPDKDIALGKNPDEWLPQHAPQFGKVSFVGSWLQYTQSLTLGTSGGVSATNSMAPMLSASAEMWLTPEWTLGASTQQSVFSVDNPVAGSGPASLTIQGSGYDLFVNYNFNLSEQTYGPKLLVGSGIDSMEFTATTSNPIALTSMKYGGMYLKVGGSVPFIEMLRSRISAEMKVYYFSSSLTEGSSNSGSSSDIRINQFSVNYSQPIRQNLNWLAGLEIGSYSSSFSGAGSRATNNASGISHKLTKINFGAEYLF